jgi:hypothetical protein
LSFQGIAAPRLQTTDQEKINQKIQVSRDGLAADAERPSESGMVEQGSLCMAKHGPKPAQSFGGYSAHPKTVLKWVRAKVLPVVRINKRCIRFNVEVCDKVMNHRTSIAKNVGHE